MRFPILLIALCLLLQLSHALGEVEKPQGRFLFQPMLIWGTSDVTHQGTGFLIKDDARHFGVTSIHFMDFDAGGLFEAIWVDIHTSKPVMGFRNSLGKPEKTAIETYDDIEHDFILMPTDRLPAGCKALELEEVGKYVPGMKLWFPNKSEESASGYEWVEAEVVKDEKTMIRVKLLSDVELRSQSGSPFLNRETGRVIGMLMGGDNQEIFLCPARSLVKRLKSPAESVPLMESIKRD